MVDTPQNNRNTAPPILRCLACGKVWFQRGPQPPKKCPQCQSLNWNRPRPTVVDVLGPPPHKLSDMIDPTVLHLARDIPEMRALTVHALDCANWISDSLKESLKQTERAQRYLATGLEILERLGQAMKPPTLPAPTQDATPEPPAPEQPPPGPPEAIPGSSPPAPDPRRRRPARKPTRSSRRSRRPSG